MISAEFADDSDELYKQFLDSKLDRVDLALQLLGVTGGDTGGDDGPRNVACTS